MPTLTSDSSADEQLQFLRLLTANIHAVQNRVMGGITPNLSRELNGMDCSMSTWVMQHETKKAGLQFAWGSQVGHAVGIITLKDGKTYYADGQGGFVEEIEYSEVPLLHGGKIITIKNHEDIQKRHRNFFPKHVFSCEYGGVTATLTNIDSMIYKQYIGDITDEVRKQYGEDALIVEQLQPFAKEFQSTVDAYDGEENKQILNHLLDELFPSAASFRASEQAIEDTNRLNEK